MILKWKIRQLYYWAESFSWWWDHLYFFILGKKVRCNLDRNSLPNASHLHIRVLFSTPQPLPWNQFPHPLEGRAPCWNYPNLWSSCILFSRWLKLENVRTQKGPGGMALDWLFNKEGRYILKKRILQELKEMHMQTERKVVSNGTHQPPPQKCLDNRDWVQDSEVV